jgi:hypothetical protein
MQTDTGLGVSAHRPPPPVPRRWPSRTSPLPPTREACPLGAEYRPEGLLGRGALRWGGRYCRAPCPRLLTASSRDRRVRQTLGRRSIRVMLWRWCLPGELRRVRRIGWGRAVRPSRSARPPAPSAAKNLHAAGAVKTAAGIRWPSRSAANASNDRTAPRGNSRSACSTERVHVTETADRDAPAVSASCSRLCRK